MQKLLVLALAGLALVAGGCKKERSLSEPPTNAAFIDTKPQAPERSADSEATPSQGSEEAGAARAAAPPAAKQPPVIARKLIRTVDLQLEVKDSVDVAKRVEAMVNQMGGYVAASNAQRQGEVVVYSLTLRVPADRIGQALNTLRSLAVRVNREHQQVQDVTDQYIDLDAHRRTLEATEAELRALLAESRQKGRKADEIMEIYEKLTEIRTQIEQIQAQINTFDKLAALSTINLELVPTESAKPVADESWHPSDTVRTSIRNLIDFLRWLVDFLIYAVIVLLPVFLVIAAAVMLLRWLWRRLGRPFRRKPASGPLPGPPPGAGPAAQ